MKRGKRKTLAKIGGSGDRAPQGGALAKKGLGESGTPSSQSEAETENGRLRPTAPGL